MTDHIPTEAVEAGAKALYDTRTLGGNGYVASAWEPRARKVLEAALPFLRPEPSEDERAIHYCPEHGDLLNRPGDGADARSHRCRTAHHIDEIRAGFARRPMPSRKQIRHAIQTAMLSSEDRLPGVSRAEWYANAVIALLEGKNDE